MPSVVVMSIRERLCFREVPAETALEQARNASAEFPGATGVWLFESLSEAPWHAWVIVPERRPELL